jgi:hypothetical protein
LSVVLFTLLFLAQPIVRRDALACSECMCGTPFPADALGGVVPAQIRYGFEDRYLSKSNALDEEPGEEEEREHRVSAFAVWRPRDRFALLARVPYNVKEIRETPLGEATTTQTSRGLGDAEAVALIGLAQSSSMRPATLGLVLGFSAPTGANGLRGRAGERLDEHLQPGAGAWSATGGLNLGVSPRGSIVEAGVLARANAEGSHHYRYGNALLFNAGVTSAPRDGWRLIAQLNGRSALRDRLPDGGRAPNTGGTVLYATPGLRWQSELGLGVETLVQIPVLQSLEGVQRERTTARIALSLDR